MKKLYDGIQRFEDEIFQALKLDLNKSVHESFTTEIGYVLKEISFQMKHISSWSKPKRVRTALTHFGSKGKVVPEPYGVTLIITVELSVSISNCPTRRSIGSRKYSRFKAVRVNAKRFKSAYENAR